MLKKLFLGFLLFSSVSVYSTDELLEQNLPKSHGEQFFNGKLREQEINELQTKTILKYVFENIYDKSGMFVNNPEHEVIMKYLSVIGAIELIQEQKVLTYQNKSIRRNVIVSYKITDENLVLQYFKEYYDNILSYLAVSK